MFAVLVFCQLAAATVCVDRQLPISDMAACLSTNGAQVTAARMQADDMAISAERWRFAGWRCRIGGAGKA